MKQPSLNPRLTLLLLTLPATVVATIVVAAIALATTAVPAAAAQEDEPRPALTVAIQQSEPVVFYTDADELGGFSIDLWAAVAEEAGFDYEWQEVETVDDQLAAVENGTADAAIAAISMTAEREQRIDFSHPYYDAGLQIMAVPRITTVLTTLGGILLSRQFLYAIGAILVLIIVIGHIVWLVERHHNPEHFPISYIQGVWEGIWWAAVTVTAVGYGDRTPRAFWGRLIGLLWMFLGLIIVANFTARLTSELTVNQLRAPVGGVEDLPDQRIATVADSTAATWLDEHGLAYREVEKIDEAYTMLEEGQVDAVVFDAPVLLHRAAAADPGTFVIVGNIFNRENYGIALPTDSPHRNAINTALLALIEEGTYDQIHKKWFATTRFE